MAHPGQRFLFDLAENLGCFVGDIVDNMMAEELVGWAALSRVRAREQRHDALRQKAEHIAKTGRL